MVKEFDLSLFIFRRDQRLVDNTALIKALARSKEVICIFIFDPILMTGSNRNIHSIQHMLGSLNELNTELREKGSQLFYFYGKSTDIIEKLVGELRINAVFENIDYSPYARKRSTEIDGMCQDIGVSYFQYQDSVLTNPHNIYTGTGGRYSIFTYFYKKSIIDPPPVPNLKDYDNYYSTKIEIADSDLPSKLTPPQNPNLWVEGGRSHALEILSKISEFEDYDDTRNIPEFEGTTNLSTYIKFGELSIREVYYAIKKVFSADNPLIRQLYWRDFYFYLSIHFPHLFNGAFKRKYNRIKWENDIEKFKKWCDGNTGFPIVDAGMRQLNSTGFMHNRVRMVVASFLVKDLHIDWKWGERYFARKLIDYDPMVNNGNWQWAASTGADAQPYFRIFNPWSQQKKFDKNAMYIKRYVPELSDMPAKAIHNLETQQPLDLSGYPSPMINHKKRAEKAKAMFKAI